MYSPSVTWCPFGTVCGLFMNILFPPSSSFSKGIRRKEHFINPTAFLYRRPFHTTACCWKKSQNNTQLFRLTPPFLLTATISKFVGGLPYSSLWWNKAFTPGYDHTGLSKILPLNYFNVHIKVNEDHVFIFMFLLTYELNKNQHNSAARKAWARNMFNKS